MKIKFDNTKRILPLLTVLILTLSGVQLSFASPLVFKATKEITKKSSDFNEFVELVGFDAIKYQKIRVGVLPVGLSEKDLQLLVVKVEAVENSDATLLDKILFSDFYPSGSVLIEIPSPKIKISANKSGTYKIFIWATE